MKVSFRKQTVETRFFQFTFDDVKSVALKNVDSEYLDEFVILKKFDKNNGNVNRKYAWDSVGGVPAKIRPSN